MVYCFLDVAHATRADGKLCGFTIKGKGDVQDESN